jgi:hypothetical protein
MFKFILAFGLIFAFTGCSLFKKAACDATKTISAAGAPLIAAKGACKNPAAIQAWIQTNLEKTKVCEPPAGITAGEIVCPGAADTLILLAGSKVPEDWQCDPALGDFGTWFKDAFITGCKTVIK